jgi:molybdopterin biosynthesis enzyme
MLAAAAEPVPPLRVPLGEAVGGIVAEPLLSERPVPSKPVALRSGFAARSLDLVGASSYAPLIPSEAPPWVEAGAFLPAGADTILPPDAVSHAGGVVEIVAEAAPGESVARTGEDAPAGALLKEAGEVFRRRDLAVALAAGLGEVSIRRPRLVVLEAGARDAADFLALTGMGAAERLVIGDGVPDLRTIEADILLVPTSDAAAVAAVLRQATEILAHRIALSPCETGRVLRVGTMPVILVEPRLDVLFAVGRCIVAPYMRALSLAAEPPLRRGRLTRKLSSRLGFTEVGLLRSTGEGFEPLAVGRLSLPALASADLWVAVPPESEGCQAGETVEACDV